VSVEMHAPIVIINNYMCHCVTMKNLSEYLRSLSFRDYWNFKNPNCKIPEIEKFKYVRECGNDYIYTDGSYFYILDCNDYCLNVSHSLEEIKCDITEKKTIIM